MKLKTLRNKEQNLVIRTPENLVEVYLQQGFKPTTKSIYKRAVKAQKESGVRGTWKASYLRPKPVKIGNNRKLTKGRLKSGNLTRRTFLSTR